MRLLIMLGTLFLFASPAAAQVDERYGATSHRGQPDGSLRPIESEFRRNGRIWTEYQEGAAGPRFVEMRREAGRIYLHDGSRRLWLRLDTGSQGRAVAHVGEGGPENIPSRWSPLDRSSPRPTVVPAATPALILEPLNPETRFDANNASIECEGRFDHLLEPRTRVCVLSPSNGQFLEHLLRDSHVWLIRDRVSTFELAFPVRAYDSLVAKLARRFGQPQPAARSDPTERTVQWTSGQARLSLTRSPGRRIAILFATYRPDYSESWSGERVFAGNYWWHGTGAPGSFAGCTLTTSPGAAAAFNPNRPGASLPQGRGPHYWLEIRGRRRDSGPGSEFSQAGVFPCEIRASEILSIRPLASGSGQPGPVSPATRGNARAAGPRQSPNRPPAGSATPGANTGSR